MLYSMSSNTSPVHVKPLFGIDPLHYIPILYAVAIVLIVAAVLLLPGIVKYGSYVEFTSYPHGAAVYIDDQYTVATPAEHYLPAGSYEITYESPYSNPYRTTIEIGGRRFASLFFPRTQSVHGKLQLVQPEHMARNTLQEFSQWSLTGGETSSYRYPAILTPTVHRLTLDDNTDNTLLIESLLAQSLSQIDSVNLARDYLGALALYEGPLPSPAAAIQILRRIGRITQASPPALLWLESVLPTAIAEHLTSRAYYHDAAEQAATELITATAPHGFGPEGLESQPLIQPERLQFNIEGQTFIFSAVPETSFLYGSTSGSMQGEIFPSPVQVEQYYMLVTPVTNQQYAAVMGLNLQDTDSAHIPKTRVSYYEAMDFAQQFQQRLGGAAFTVSLPTTEQWEAAARWNGDPLPDAVLFSPNRTGPAPAGNSTGNIGLSDLSGNVWEWTKSWYQPAAGYQLDTGYALPSEQWEQAEKIVRGAGWANRRGSITVEQIGVQPPDWQTEYLGFRIVLAAE